MPPTTKHWIVSKIHTRAEFETSTLGLAVFEGREDVLKNALADGIDWANESKYLLEAAIHGNQIPLAKLLLSSGMPVQDSFYPLIMYWSADQSLLKLLPSAPHITKPIEDELQWSQFLWNIVEGKMDGVKKNFNPAMINRDSAILGGQVSMKPIHHAARKCHFEIMKFLVSHGADIKALDGEGKSVLRLISECPSVEDHERKECFRFIEGHGGELVPPVEGWFRKWSLSRGAWLR